MMTIGLPALIEDTAKALRDSKISKSVVESVIEKFIEQTKQRLHAGNTVVIREFIRLEPKDLNTRKGRNPRTGEIVEVPAKRRLLLKPSPILLAELNTKK